MININPSQLISETNFYDNIKEIDKKFDKIKQEIELENNILKK